EAQASAKLVVAGTRVEDLKAARATVDGAQGRLDQIRVMIDELVVRAPRQARVESLDLRPGDILAANATAATLLEDDQLYVRIYVPETRIGRIRVGDEVPITVDSFPGRSFKGVVEHINSVGEYSPRNLQTADERADQVFATRIGLREGRDDLRAGMAAFITVAR
ncbi:MAG TPA: HlyD family efflux transporter periplasmic adaptor subunit, partial [Polyangiaceae bacterium]|nr:HlyD family efflux transporter periplasmic adaptor subunit [Polyangiaceae bacterium]